MQPALPLLPDDDRPHRRGHRLRLPARGRLPAPARGAPPPAQYRAVELRRGLPQPRARADLRARRRAGDRAAPGQRREPQQGRRRRPRGDGAYRGRAHADLLDRRHHPGDLRPLPTRRQPRPRARPRAPHQRPQAPLPQRASAPVLAVHHLRAQPPPAPRGAGARALAADGLLPRHNWDPDFAPVADTAQVRRDLGPAGEPRARRERMRVHCRQLWKDPQICAGRDLSRPRRAASARRGHVAAQQRRGRRRRGVSWEIPRLAAGFST